MTTPKRSRPALEELEARILYSADVSPVAMVDIQIGTHVMAEQAAPVSAPADLLVVDSRVWNYQSLIDDLTGKSRPFEVVVIGSDEDGVARVGQALAGRHDIASIHVISHGQAGALELGATRLDSDTLLARAGEVSAWGSALTPDGDILLYGCDVAENDAGRQFVSQLAALTGADVAASANLTGHTAQGGDWSLEFRVGAIASTNLFAPATLDALRNWQGTLATYTVTNTNDTGAGSLRQAIVDANANAGADLISFGIAGAGVHTITLGSALPFITDAVIIDATTDDSFAANASRPAIVLDGNGLTTDGLTLSATAGGSTIRGLAIQNFQGDGIQINSGSDGNIIAGNWIGSLSAGGGGVGNSAAGILVLGANNTIGGTTEADRNVISGNANGVVISGASATGNQVIGNYLGTDDTGNAAIANTFDGVRIQNDATANAIGGSSTDRRNIISGNGQDGVQIDGEASDGNSVQSNWIGIGADGTTVLGTGGDGILVTGGADNSLIGGPGANDGNWIASPGLLGIEIDGTSTGTTIQGNRIGTDLAGIANWGAQQNGILIENSGSGSGPSDNLITDNVVAFSGQGNAFTPGIRLPSTAGTANTILRNAVYSNVGLGIDLGVIGVTANDSGDSDSGPNNLQNFPVLSSAITDGGSQIVIAGTLNSTANGYFRIEFFASPSADATGFGEGQTYLGFVNVTTDGAGNGSFSTTLAANVPAGYTISATATRADASYTTLSDTSEFALSVTAIAPPVNTAPGPQTVAEDTPLAIGGISVNDPDDNLATIALEVANGTLSVDLTGGASISDGSNGSSRLTLTGSQAQINTALATLTYQGNNNFFGSDTLSILSTDALGSTDLDNVAITVTAVNDAPAVTNPISNQTAMEDSVFNYQFAANTFADPDIGDTLTYSASGLPVWLNFDPATRTFSGTPANADVGTISITVTATDAAGLTAGDTFDLVVINTNDTPTVANPIPNQTATENTPFNFTFAVNTFADQDIGDILSYSAQLNGGGALPAWLSFDAATRTFSGTPGNADVGTVSIDVTADDGNGGTVTDTFTLTVGNVNDAPYVANPIPNQNTTEDVAFNFQFAANTFADPDIGDTLTYAAELAGGGVLPPWLNFDPATRTFSGTPSNADVGTISITVTATDAAGLTAGDTFDLVVINTNDTPTVASPIPNQTATENTPFNFTFAVSTFADEDIGDILTYSAQLNGGGALPAWLSFDPATRTFSGTPANADVGTISITVTATDAAGLTAGDTFDLVVINTNDTPVGLPAVTGSTTLGATLTADTSAIADPDGLGAFTYQWLRNGVAIGGATGSTYTLIAADVGSQLSVTLSYTDGHGTAESLTSAQTAIVTHTNLPPAVAPPSASWPPSSGDGGATATVGSGTGNEGSSSMRIPAADTLAMVQRLDLVSPPALTMERPSVPLQSALHVLQRQESGAVAGNGIDELDMAWQTRSIMLFRQIYGGGAELPISLKADPSQIEATTTIDTNLDELEVAGLLFAASVVWWTLRGMASASGTATAMSDWRDFDPLPVLGPLAEEDWCGVGDKEADGDQADVAEASLALRT